MVSPLYCKNSDYGKIIVLYLPIVILFPERFTQMKQSGGYYVTVIEDTRSSKIIGAATLTIEQKFIHNCSFVSKVYFTYFLIVNSLIMLECLQQFSHLFYSVGAWKMS